MKLISAGCAAALMLLAGCDAGKQITLADLAPANPGNASLTRNETVELFSQVCLDTAPDFANAPIVLDALPVQRNFDTGTYFHETLNLSFKLISRDDVEICSMVMASDDDPVPAILNAAQSSDLDVTISPPLDIEGETYYRIQAESAG